MDGLGGSEWNRRPAGGNSMWRLYYLSRKDNVPLVKGRDVVWDGFGG